MIGLIWAQQFESGYGKRTGDILLLSKLVTLEKFHSATVSYKCFHNLKSTNVPLLKSPCSRDRILIVKALVVSRHFQQWECPRRFLLWALWKGSSADAAGHLCPELPRPIDSIDVLRTKSRFILLTITHPGSPLLLNYPQLMWIFYLPAEKVELSSPAPASQRDVSGAN